MGWGRDVAGGGISGAIVGPGEKQRGFRATCPSTGKGMIMAVLTEQKTETVFRGNEVVDSLKPALRTHSLNPYAMAECALFPTSFFHQNVTFFAPDVQALHTA